MCANADIIIDSYKPDHIPQILSLTKATLGDSGAVRKTQIFWEWKHERNPVGSSYGLLARSEIDREAIGLRVLMRWEFTALDDRPIRAFRAVDTATHPNYRRLGIFSQLTLQAVNELQEQGADLIFNTPNDLSLPGYLKLGWRFAARWPLYMRVLRPISMAMSRLSSKQASSFDLGDYFSNKIVSWPRFWDYYGNRLPDFISHWELQRPRVGLRTNRNMDFLTWRYGQHPHITYGVYPHLENGVLRAWAVLRPNRRFGWRENVLCDLFLDAPDVALGKRFISSMLKQLRSDYVIAHANAKTFEQDLLRRSFFFKIPQRSIRFAVRPLQPANAIFTTASAWDLSLGDLEVF